MHIESKCFKRLVNNQSLDFTNPPFSTPEANLFNSFAVSYNGWCLRFDKLRYISKDFIKGLINILDPDVYCHVISIKNLKVQPQIK